MRNVRTTMVFSTVGLTMFSADFEKKPICPYILEINMENCILKELLEVKA